jgi:hypothetical protein
MQVATNPRTNETAVLVGDKWQRVEQIAQDPSGRKAYLVGGQWMSDQGEAANLPSPPPAGPTRAERIQGSGPYRALVGATDPFRGVAQMVAKGGEFVSSAGGMFPNPVSDYFKSEGQALTQEVKQRDAAIEAARQRQTQQADPGMDWWRFGGQVFSPANYALAKAVPIPAGRSTGNLVVKGGVIGAAGGAMQPVTGGEENFWTTKAVQSGVGALSGAMMTPAVARVTEAILPKLNSAIAMFSFGGREAQGARASLETDQIIAQALKEIGQSADDLPQQYMRQLRDQVVTALKSGKRLDPATLMRAEDFKSLGIVPTKGQVTRDATQFATERNLRGVANAGEPLMNRFTAQNQRLAELLNPRNPKEAFQAGDDIVRALKDTDEMMRKRVSGMYTAARQKAGKDLDVPLQGLAQDAARVVDDFADKVPTAVRNRLASYGIFGGKQTRTFSPQEADNLLKLINDHVGNDTTTNKALDGLRAAVKRTMSEGDVPDVFAPARAAAAKRFKLQELVPALDDAAAGRTAPDDFVQRYIVRGKTQDVKNLVELLRNSNPEAAAEAKRQVGAVLARAAFGENVAGDKLFSPERFAQAVRSIGTDKLKAFYTVAEVEQLKTIGRVGAYINSIPTAAPVSSSNSQVPIVNLLMQTAAPGKVGVLASALAPVFNSIKNTRAINDALLNNGPAVARNITPQQAAVLSRILSGTGLAAGAGAAAPLQ